MREYPFFDLTGLNADETTAMIDVIYDYWHGAITPDQAAADVNKIRARVLAQETQHDAEHEQLCGWEKKFAGIFG